MIFAMSNIAWLPEERHEAYAALADAGFDGLEIAPGLLFAGAEDPMRPDEGRVRDVRTELENHGLRLVSMQSLLFGVDDAALFGSEEQRRRFETAMHRAIDLAGRLHIPNIVFGSPRQRVIPDDMDGSHAHDHAVATFGALANRASKAGTVIAMEPNPADYGTNFLTTLEQAASFVASVDHPALRLNYDLGAVIMNGDGDRAADLARTFISHIHHVHVSEPELAPAPADPAPVAGVLRVLEQGGYDGAVSIEMRRDAERGVVAVRDSIAALVRASERRAA